LAASTSAPSDTNELELAFRDNTVPDTLNAETLAEPTHYGPSEDLMAASTSAPSDINFEHGFHSNAVQGTETATEATHYEPAEDLLAASTSAPSDTNELELAFRDNTVPDTLNAETLAEPTHYGPSEDLMAASTSAPSDINFEHGFHNNAVQGTETATEATHYGEQPAEDFLVASTSAPSDTNELEHAFRNNTVPDALNEETVPPTHYEPSEDLLAASTSAPSDINYFDHGFHDNAVQGTETVIETTHYEPAQHTYPAFTSTIAETHQPELFFTMNAPKKEIATQAANSVKDASVLAKKKTPLKAKILNELPLATAQAQTVPTHMTHEDHGEPLAKAAPYYKKYATRGTHAPLGHRTRPDPPTKDASTSFNYPSVPTTAADAYAMPPTETKPLTSVESNLDEERHVPASHHTKRENSKHHHHHMNHNGDY